MAVSIYDKNFFDGGYYMNYRSEKTSAFLKNKIYQFKITLKEISPVIWRRIQVPAWYNFWDLHVAIQDAMGWTDSHLHHFEIKGKGKIKKSLIGIPDFSGSGELPEVFPGWEIMMYSYFNDLGITAEYLYDYGDNWVHEVVLEGYLYPEKGVKYPVCLGGERACPPEDCGSVDGYYNVLSTLADKKNDDYKSMRTWVGRNWDSEKFDKDKVKFDNPFKRWEYAFLES
jgi:hypothetical protein